jgi:membrane protein DedA with SNARE-associated domain
MDGPAGGRAPGALRRKALKVLLIPSGSGSQAHNLQQTQGGRALIGIRYVGGIKSHNYSTGGAHWTHTR